MYNKSEIMTTAWRNYNNARNAIVSKLTRNGVDVTSEMAIGMIQSAIKPFATYLRQAWSAAKANTVVTNSNTGFTNVHTLAAGNRIEVAPPGCASMAEVKTVESIERAPLGYAGISVKFTDGTFSVFHKADVVRRAA